MYLSSQIIEMERGTGAGADWILCYTCIIFFFHYSNITYKSDKREMLNDYASNFSLLHVVPMKMMGFDLGIYILHSDCNQAGRNRYCNSLLFS